MRGVSSHIGLKRDIASGTLLGPTVFAGSPPLSETDAQTSEGAIARMMANRSAGFDLQTLSADIPMAVWDSLTEEAHSRGYSFGGTIPASIGLRHALSSGISTVEHLDGYLKEVVSDPIRIRLDRGEDVPLDEQMRAVEGRKMRAMAAHTRASDTWVVPTMYLWEIRSRPLNVDSLLSFPEMSFVNESMREDWILQKGRQAPLDPETAELLVGVRQRLLRALAMAGAGVLLGTGSPEMFNVPGFALRHELESMEAAGLTPYEALVAGTRNVAEYARDELLEPGNFGTIAEGNRADLILLRENPFQDMEALWSQEGIMIRGRWISKEEIDQRLKKNRP